MILGETPDGMLGVLDHLIPDITDCAKKEQQPSGADLIGLDIAGPGGVG